MLIRFSRPKGKTVLTCVRDNGGGVYQRPSHGAFFAVHDLIHYVVETTLGYRNAFFGLIAQGWSIEDFERPGVAARLPPEALHAELIVNQLMQELAFDAPRDAAEFNRVLAESAAQSGGGPIPAPRPLSDPELRAIRTRCVELRARCERLQPGECVELSFPRPADDACAADSFGRPRR